MPVPAATARACGRLLLATMPDLMRGIAETARRRRPGPEGLANMAQLHLLATLQRSPRSLRELAAIHHVTPSSMSRSVSLLVRKGWVVRAEDAADRRQVILRLTDEGRAAQAAMVQLIEDAVTEVLGRLGEAERARLYAGLDVLRSLTGGDHACGDRLPAGLEHGAVVAPHA